MNGAAPRTLQDWLDLLERSHPRPIDLGLERSGRVLRVMDLAPPCPVVTVGGTNGKGSVCAMLESVYRAAGWKTALYTSPHLLRYNERVRVRGQDASDEALAESFAAVERSRIAAGDVSLTYFEAGTLAAMYLFTRARPDVIILEVGLGGRLDAVNLFDADCAVVVSVGMDHMDWLGPTREHIGYEKACIFRPGRPAVVADADPPRRLLAHAREIGAIPRLIGLDFGWRGDRAQWNWWGPDGAARRAMAAPALRGARQLDNASAALMVLHELSERLPVPMQAVRTGLATVSLPARFQILPGRPSVVLDVAHNEPAAAVLAQNLAQLDPDFENAGAAWAVFGMLADKDIEAVCRQLRGQFRAWFVGPLTGPRAADGDRLRRAILAAEPGAEVRCFDSPAAAFAAAKARAGRDDRIVAFGSFLTVAAVMAALPAGTGS